MACTCVNVAALLTSNTRSPAISQIIMYFGMGTMVTYIHHRAGNYSHRGNLPRERWFLHYIVPAPPATSLTDCEHLQTNTTHYNTKLTLQHKTDITTQNWNYNTKLTLQHIYWHYNTKLTLQHITDITTHYWHHNTLLTLVSRYHAHCHWITKSTGSLLNQFVQELLTLFPFSIIICADKWAKLDY